MAARSSAAAAEALHRQSSHDESSECEEIQRIHGRLHNAEDEPSDDVDSAIGDIVSAQRDRSTRRVLSMGFDLASIRGGHLSELSTIILSSSGVEVNFRFSRNLRAPVS